MSDQADKLRDLVAEAVTYVVAHAALPPTIVVTGGKRGVGTTTVATNLAASLTHNGHRTVLVDAAPNADAAQLLGLDAAQRMAFVRRPKRSSRVRRGFRCYRAGRLPIDRPIGRLGGSIG
jgi:Flp pilus assembly CpaE family ATPase